MSERLSKSKSQRIIGIDVLRGIAIILMVAFHFVWNLWEFKAVSDGFIFSKAWRGFGSVILAMFLSISGFVSYWHWQKGFTWPNFFKRTWKVAAAALLISISSNIVSQVQNSSAMFIFFGVLHHITLGLVFLALLRKFPTYALAILAVFCFLAPMLLRHEFFNTPALWWIGLCETIPVTVDYVPILPWFWMMLVGAMLARLLPRKKVVEWGAMSSAGSWVKPLAWMGKYSLLIYLVHQPLLYGATALWFNMTQ